MSGSSPQSKQLLVFKGANKVLLTARQGSSIKEVAQREQEKMIADIGCSPKVMQLLEDIRVMETNRVIGQIDSV